MESDVGHLLRYDKDRHKIFVIGHKKSSNNTTGHVLAPPSQIRTCSNTLAQSISLNRKDVYIFKVGCYCSYITS